MKERWAIPEYKDKMKKKFKEVGQRAEIKAMRKRMSKEMWDEDMKKAASERLKGYWEKPEYRKKMEQMSKKMWDDPEYRNNQIRKMNERWNNIEWVHRKFSRGNYYKFTFPSGRIVKLQGYEPQVLEQLLQIYNEDDIICEVKDINKEIGKILYQYKGKERRYYPDFYIKSTNTIIEVKSQWTFDKWKDKNLAKGRACIEQGFNFECVIIQ